ncbi:MAG: metallophosphoesterase [Acidobacteria bacterium]|nr:metallophosphoesterase [Acidobacteriota bacterium]
MQFVRLAIFLVFIALMYITQRYWFLGAWHWIGAVQHPGLKTSLKAVWFLALAIFVAAFLDPMLGHFLPRAAGGKWIIAMARVWLIASFFAFLAVKLVGAVGWIAAAGARLVSAKDALPNPARRDFFRYAGYLAGSIPFLAASYGYAAGRLKYRVERVEVPVANLPKELDGLKIVQLSDIHIGDFMPREEVRRAVGLANELQADLAVITGDFISDHNDPLADCIAELSQLRAPLGRWGCNGNHEIYADAEERAQQLFAQHGMKLLRQENAVLEHNGAKFNLIGVDYQRDRMTRGPRGPMLQDIERLISREMPNILLSHNPNSFHRAADLGIELSLAGHTHGGQVKFEIVDHDISPARLITDFVAGFYQLPMGTKQDAKSAIYVNRGLGTFGMPVRLNVPPEITLLTLRSA